MTFRSYNQLDRLSNVLSGERDDPADVAFEKSAPGDMEFRIEFPLNDLFPMSSSEDLNIVFTEGKDHLEHNRLAEARTAFRAYRAKHRQHLRSLNLEAIACSRIYGDGPEVLDLFLEGLAIAARYLSGVEAPEGFTIAPTAIEVRLQQAQLYINLGACYHDLSETTESAMVDATNAFIAGYAVLESCLNAMASHFDKMDRVCAYCALRVADAALRSGQKRTADRYLDLALSHDPKFSEGFLSDRGYLKQLHTYHLSSDRLSQQRSL